MSDKPPHMQAYPLLGESDIQNIDALYRKRLQSMQAVDEMIGQLVATLQAKGLLHNTYVVFTSDNGFHMGQHRLLPGKGRGYEEDIRVPLIVRGPGVPPGSTRDELASFIDLAPTFADIAGVAMPTAIDGRSLLSLLHTADPASPWRSASYVEYYYAPGSNPDSAMGGEPPDWPPHPPQGFDPGGAALFRSPDDEAVLDYSAIRTAYYKFIQPGSSYTRELYDLVADPFELENRIWTADPLFVRRLEAWMASFRTCAADGCRALEIRQPPFGCDVVAAISEGECEALVAFFNSTGGNAWLRRDGWLTSNTPCSWYGVTCEDGHVTGLVLPANELEGLLPNGLSALPELRQLILAGGVLTSTNHLAGSIPPELGSLDNLQTLDLSRNKLSGSLPAALGSLSSLQALNVAGNYLSGVLPLELTALTVTTFRFEETNLCIPDDPGMHAWLSAIATLGSTATVCQLVLTHTAEAPALTGGSLTYHLSVENRHTGTTVTRITLRDTLPAGVTVVSTTPPASQQGSLLTWTIGSLAPGARYDATLVVSVPAMPVRLTNKATAEGQLGSYQVVQTSYVGDVLPWADFDGDRRVTESDIQMIGWCWQQPTGGICRPEYHVDPDADTDVVDIMRAAATY